MDWSLTGGRSCGNGSGWWCTCLRVFVYSCVFVCKRECVLECVSARVLWSNTWSKPALMAFTCYSIRFSTEFLLNNEQLKFVVLYGLHCQIKIVFKSSSQNIVFSTGSSNWNLGRNSNLSLSQNHYWTIMFSARVHWDLEVQIQIFAEIIFRDFSKCFFLSDSFRKIYLFSFKQAWTVIPKFKNRGLIPKFYPFSNYIG